MWLLVWVQCLILNQLISKYSLQTLGYCLALFLQFGCALQAVSIPHLSCCSVRVDRNLAGSSTMAVNGRRHLPSVQEGDDLVLWRHKLPRFRLLQRLANEHSEHLDFCSREKLLYPKKWSISENINVTKYKIWCGQNKCCFC